MSDLEQLQDDFINQWGILGSAWGITKTMAQIQALLMTATEPLSTDDIMERLSISRGNAHNSLKELLLWGIIQKVHIRGERREFFNTEKDPWKIFFNVARERRRREIEPLLGVLRQIEKESYGLKEEEAAEFQQQMTVLREFVELGDKALGTIADAEKKKISQWILKLLR